MANGAKVVAVDSTWDANVLAASEWRHAYVHPYLEEKGFPVNELAGQAANKQQADAAVSAPEIAYVTGVSHGRNDAFTGADNFPVFEMENEPGIFRGKIVHFLACNTADFLGRNLIIPGGAAAFFGYIGEVAWLEDGAGTLANVFFDCDAEIDRALADRQTAHAAALRAIAKFDQQIAALTSIGDGHAAAALERARDMLRSPCHGAEYGNQNAKLP